MDNPIGVVSDATEHASMSYIHCRFSGCVHLGQWRVGFHSTLGRNRCWPHYWCSDHLPKKYRAAAGLP